MQKSKTILIREAFDRTNSYLRASEFKGYEFDDYLASPIVKFLCFGNLFLQRVAVQVGKLNPINIRPLLGIPKLESTKARGFIAKGNLAMYQATGEPEYLEQAKMHLEWLLSHPSAGYQGLSWGNAFDFASRGGFFPKGRPTIVWTSHIAETFDLAYQMTHKSQYVEAVKSAGDFILMELERHEDEHGHCFAYAPGILNLVHNSNLLGAATLLRAWQHCPDDRYLQNSKRAYQWTLAHQNADGGWYYGAESKYHWIDNFHTAYNIDCFITAYELAGDSIVPWGVIERSYQFWIDRFFDDDGGPRYFHDRAYPYDIQSAAQAIETLNRCGAYFEGAYDLADRVLHWTLDQMLMANGAFRFQLRPFWKNNQESLHWGQATMLSALGAAMNATEERKVSRQKRANGHGQSEMI